MKWLLYGLTGLFVALIAGLFVAPGFVDWDVYRDRIAHHIHLRTGYDVKIEGPVSVALLPKPQLILTQITVRDPGDTDPRVSIRWLSVQASLPALLQGRFRITRVSVVEPEMRLDGFSLPSRENLGELNIGVAGAQFEGDFADPYLLDGSIEIENGYVELSGGENGFLFTGVIDADSKTGRWSGELHAEHNDAGFDVDFRLTQNARESDARLKASIKPSDAEATVDLVGDVKLTGKQGLVFSGKLVAAIDEPAPTLKPWFPQVAQFLAPSGIVRFEAQADLASSYMDLREIRFESPGGTGSGFFTVDLSSDGRADIGLKFSRLDIDALRRNPEAQDDQSRTAELPTPERGETGFPAFKQQFSRLAAVFQSSGLDAEINVFVRALQFRGALVRDADLRLAVDDGAVTVEGFTALLPGSSSFSLAGYGTITEHDGTFEGNLAVKADDLRRLMSWAGLEAPAIAADRLRSLAFVSGLKYASKRLDFVDASVIVDGVEADISAAVALRDRPGVGVRISVDRLNLDAYRALNDAQSGSQIATEPEGLETGNRAGSLGVVDASSKPPFDAIVDLNINQLIIARVPVDQLSGRLEYRNGILRSDALTFADAGGLAGSVMGEFDTGLENMPGTASLRGHGEEFGALAAILGSSDTIATRIRQFGESDVTVLYERDGSSQEVAFQISGEKGNSAGELSWFSEDGDVRAEMVNGELTLGLVNATGISFSAVLTPSGDAVIETLDGELNGGELSGTLQVSRSEGVWRGNGNVSVTDVPVDHLLEGLRGKVRTQGHLSFQSDILIDESHALADQNTLMFNGSVSGAFGLALSDETDQVVRVARIERIKAIIQRAFTEPRPLQGTFRGTDRNFSVVDVTIDGADNSAIVIDGDVDFPTQSVRAEVTVESRPAPVERLTISGPVGRPGLRLSN